MSVINMAKDIKKVHPDFVVMYKVGNFVQSFGKDAAIISYVFKYKIMNTKDGVLTCGFPKNAIPKAMATLENKKINYIIIDTRNNYEVDEKADNKNLNCYDVILVKAQKYVKIKKRLEEVENSLIKNVNQENIMDKIRKIEEIVYEN